MIKSWFYDLFYFRIWFPFKNKIYIVYENSGYIVYSDHSYVHKMYFLELCLIKGLDWVANMEYLYPHYLFDEVKKSVK